MTGKFKVKDLMVHVAPEDDKKCHGESSKGPPSPQSGCPRPSCQTVPYQGRVFRGAGLDELTRSNLALLQKELRQALDLGR